MPFKPRDSNRSDTRPAAVAGLFYPGQPAELRDTVQGLLDRAAAEAPAQPSLPKVLVVPHAGYIYSGPLAALAYSRLRGEGGRIRRVVLVGPAHRVGFHGIATSPAAAFATPLGVIPLDRAAIDKIGGLPGVRSLDQAHALEHSLEVHLPFLQSLLDNFTLVPLVVGEASPEQVAAVLEQLWGGDDTLLVISTDLSHFHSYEAARVIDGETAALIEAREPVLEGEQACGCRGLNGLLVLLRTRGLGIERVGLCNSGDTAGDRDRVVGYGAWVVEEYD